MRRCASTSTRRLYEIQGWAGQGGRSLFDTILVFENYPVDQALRERDSRGLHSQGLRFGDGLEPGDDELCADPDGAGRRRHRDRLGLAARRLRCQDRIEQR